MQDRIFEASPYQVDSRKLFRSLLIDGPSAMTDFYSPVCVADVLKRLIKSLPQSLLTDELVYHFVESLGGILRF